MLQNGHKDKKWKYDMLIYYILYVENLLHVSVTFCGHLQCGLQPPPYPAWMVLRAHNKRTVIIQLNLTKLINH